MSCHTASWWLCLNMCSTSSYTCHTRPYKTTQKYVTHNFPFLIPFNMSNTITNSFLFAPVKAIAHKFLLVIDWDAIWTWLGCQVLSSTREVPHNDNDNDNDTDNDNKFLLVIDRDVIWTWLGRQVLCSTGEVPHNRAPWKYCCQILDGLDVLSILSVPLHGFSSPYLWRVLIYLWRFFYIPVTVAALKVEWLGGCSASLVGLAPGHVNLSSSFQYHWYIFTSLLKSYLCLSRVLYN